MGAKRTPASARKGTPKRGNAQKSPAKKVTKAPPRSASKSQQTPKSSKKEKKKQPVVEKEESSEEEESESGEEESSEEEENDSNDDQAQPSNDASNSESSEDSESDDEEEPSAKKAALKGDDIWGGSDDEVEETEIEREARLEEERVAEDEAYEEELAENQERSAVMETFELPGDGEEQETQEEVGARIKEIVGILNDFRARAKDHTQSRSDFIEQLTKDCAKYYQYLPELISLFLTLFSPNELIEFLEANEIQRPVVIRTNTLKARRRDLAEALASRGVNLQPLAPWTKVGLKILESEVPIGATPEYLAGHYMLQSAASFTPVIAMEPQPGEKILDMASAPGGKTSYVAQLMKNTGLLVANDLKKERIAATVANLARLGVRNTVCCNHNGKDFPKVVGGFDRVLLDAPCSGLGVIARDPSVKMQRTVHDIRSTAHLQKELLLAAIDSCDHKSRTGGIIVYSTCSISAEENEMVVQYALEKRHVKLVDPKVEYAKKGLTRYMHHRFHPSMSHTRRLYPHVHNMDGFFVAKFKKLSNKKEGSVSKSQQDDEDESESESDEGEMEVEVDQGPKSNKERKKEKREQLLSKKKSKTKAVSTEQQQDDDVEMQVDDEPKSSKKSKKGQPKSSKTPKKAAAPSPSKSQETETPKSAKKASNKVDESVKRSKSAKKQAKSPSKKRKRVADDKSTESAKSPGQKKLASDEVIKKDSEPKAASSTPSKTKLKSKSDPVESSTKKASKTPKSSKKSAKTPKSSRKK